MKNVLLIDDSEPDNFLHQYMLNKSQQFGTIESVLNVEQALELLRSKAANGEKMPDIILLDINMPRMNGWEFLDSTKEETSFTLGNTTIYMLTTSSNPDDQEKAKSYGLKDYFLKPLNEEHIKVLLNN